MSRLLEWMAGVFPSSAYMGQDTPPNQINRRQGEIHLSKPAYSFNVNSVMERNYLVEKTIQLVKLKKNLDMPRNTSDLKVEMFSVLSKVTQNGQVYMQRNWWLQIGHPYVPYIEAVIQSGKDERWEKLGTVGSHRLGIACVYTDETIVCMLRELIDMFAEQQYEIEDDLPEYEEEEDDDDDDEEEQEEIPLNSIILQVGEVEDKPTTQNGYSVFGSSTEGAKKAD